LTLVEDMTERGRAPFERALSSLSLEPRAVLDFVPRAAVVVPRAAVVVRVEDPLAAFDVPVFFERDPAVEALDFVDVVFVRTNGAFFADAEGAASPREIRLRGRSANDAFATGSYVVAHQPVC